MSFIEFEKSIRHEDWSMQDLHSHVHYEIYFLAKGSRSFFLSNALYQVQAPVLIVIPPHVMHKTEGDPFERYNLNVAPAYLDPFQKETLESKALHIIQLSEAQAQDFVKLFDEAIALDHRKRHAEYIRKGMFSNAMLMLSKLDERSLPPSAANANDMPPLVLKVIDYLNAHYAEKQTLDSLCARFFVSKSTLMYNFKKYTNCSLIDFLLNVRLTKAKQMLINTHKSVREISEQCGFSSANYFGLIFKSKENQSPAAYRKNQRAKG